MSGAVLLAVNDFPPLLGGEAALYHGLARHLPPGQVLVLAPRAAGQQAIDSALRLEVVRRWLPAHRGPLSRAARALLGLAHLLSLLSRRRVRYLLCGQLLSLGGPVGLVARGFRLPYAVFVHGADLLDSSRRLPLRLLARWVVAGADAVVANSRFTAALVDRLLPGVARRLLVLPLGVDPPPRVDPSMLEALRRRYALGDGPVLLSVARLVPMKGHDVVIEALPALLARFRDLHYLVVGEGPRRAALEARARERGVERAVIFAGRIDAPELPAHYRLATIFVQLSRATGGPDGLEGFGLTFLEAASHGLSCIAGRSGGVPEAVDEGRSGLLVPPEEPDAFAAAAGRLLAAPAERARLARGALAWAAEHSWEKAARCLSDLVEGH